MGLFSKRDSKRRISPLPSYLRERIRDRDNRLCALCGKTEALNGRVMDVHHINGNPVDNRESNLVSLCRVCHREMDKNPKRYFPRRVGRHMWEVFEDYYSRCLALQTAKSS